MGIWDTSRCLSFVSFTVKTIAFVKKTKGNAFQIGWVYYEQRFHEYVSSKYFRYINLKNKYFIWNLFTSFNWYRSETQENWHKDSDLSASLLKVFTPKMVGI